MTHRTIASIGATLIFLGGVASFTHLVEIGKGWWGIASLAGAGLMTIWVLATQVDED